MNFIRFPSFYKKYTCINRIYYILNNASFIFLPSWCTRTTDCISLHHAHCCYFNMQIHTNFDTICERIPLTRFLLVLTHSNDRINCVQNRRSLRNLKKFCNLVKHTLLDRRNTISYSKHRRVYRHRTHFQPTQRIRHSKLVHTWQWYEHNKTNYHWKSTAGSYVSTYPLVP